MKKLQRDTVQITGFFNLQYPGQGRGTIISNTLKTFNTYI